MNRVEYMKELERLLQNIPENERKEALAYYEDYFNDAGEENEQQVIQELGYPAKVAENIKEGLRGNMGYSGIGNQNMGYQHIETQNVYTNSGAKTDKMPAWEVALIVIACIMLSPFILGVLGTVFGLIMGAFGVTIGFFAAGVGLVIAAVALIGAGITTLWITPYAGIGLIGAGLLLGAIGILMIAGTIWLCFWGLPNLVRWIIGLCKRAFGKDKNGVN